MNKVMKLLIGAGSAPGFSFGVGALTEIKYGVLKAYICYK